MLPDWCESYLLKGRTDVGVSVADELSNDDAVAETRYLVLMTNIASGNAIAEIAALIGDTARANILSELMGGQALTAGELASRRVSKKQGDRISFETTFRFADKECRRVLRTVWRTVDRDGIGKPGLNEVPQSTL